MDRIALNKEMHPESLERLCATALAAGDAETAFMYADRRCRIHPLAKAHHFTLRAETLMRLGDKEAAIADIRTALALAPDDIQANRRMLAWGDGERQLAAAKTLTKIDDDAETLIRALNALQKSGTWCGWCGTCHRRSGGGLGGMERRGECHPDSLSSAGKIRRLK